MKSYFPFTDYDFYAYLTSGAFLLSVVDYAVNDAVLLARTDWTFVQTVIAIATAYVTGHIVATFAQLVVEKFLVSKVISKPIELQLGYKTPNFVERTLGVLVGRYYEPLNEAVQAKIRQNARLALSLPDEQVLGTEDVFQAGFSQSFSVEGARPRIDSFLNQYGFCRNISFVALVASVLAGWQAFAGKLPESEPFLVASVLVFIGMFIRFVKFYAAFQAEVTGTLLK